MTFTEAAVEVLKREGKPLHFRKIAEIAIRENLLDHVGKIPEETMADQLTAHCRLPSADRRIVVVQHGTFALEEWGLPEDPAGLEQLVEPPPADEPTYRPKERHPIPARELGRGMGREGGRGRYREEGEEKRRRFPPPAEVAYEILAGAEHPLSLRELAALGAERTLMPDAFLRDVESLGAALREDNRRRASSGRKALFAIEGDLVTLEAQPEPGERPAPVAGPRPVAGPDEMRGTALATLRRRLRACDAATAEWLAARLLEKMGMRELKVAKRGREHVVFTARRRLGLVEIRHCIRVVRSGADAGRRDVADLRRDLGHYGAQIGVLVTAGEAGREARGEASAAGQMPVVLLAGEAFAEAFAEHAVACKLIAIPEVDEAFLREASDSAQREEAARRARREERERRGDRERGDERPRRERPEGERPERGEPAEPPPAEVAEAVAPPAPAEGEEPKVPAAAPDLAAPNEADEGEEDDSEAGEGEDAEPGSEARADARETNERRRRRRRRRRRGGRGRGERRPEGEGSAPASPAAEAGAPVPAPAEPASPAPPSPPPAAASDGGESG
ncbi:MAG TPA: HTH domain-containing protein [Anaeromyxobacteraceae bacterium]|nr:HTH domain-containing protein [Anaeromyxobacteraceae bacterium]